MITLYALFLFYPFSDLRILEKTQSFSREIKRAQALFFIPVPLFLALFSLSASSSQQMQSIVVSTKNVF